MRLKGKGMPGMGGGAEPAMRSSRFWCEPHPVFKREGDDIVVEVPITFDEAVLGGKVEVPTITGNVFATVPPGTRTPARRCGSRAAASSARTASLATSSSS